MKDTGFRTKTQEKVNVMLDMLTEGYHSLDELAQAMSVSRQRADQLFQQVFGKKIYETYKAEHHAGQ